MHFAVMVFGDNVEQQLAPFQQTDMGHIDPKYMAKIDYTDEVHEEFQGPLQCIRLSDGRHLAPAQARDLEEKLLAGAVEVLLTADGTQPRDRLRDTEVSASVPYAVIFRGEWLHQDGLDCEGEWNEQFKAILLKCRMRRWSPSWTAINDESPRIPTAGSHLPVSRLLSSRSSMICWRRRTYCEGSPRSPQSGRQGLPPPGHLHTRASTATFARAPQDVANRERAMR